MVDQEQLGLLKRSVEEWNKWRAENPRVKIDLRGTNLSRSNLRNADLRFAYLNSANLRGANLRDANLSSSDLRNADLGATDLKYANLMGSYLVGAKLKNADLRDANLKSAHLDLANLRGADFRNADLRFAYLNSANLNSANLKNANLKNAHFRDTKLDSANLDNANLGCTKLIATQALKTNFKNANLTGACIEDWHINSETQFKDVICEYIYLKEEYQDSEWVFSERRPHDLNKNFAPGEFISLIEQANETLDLIFSKGIDWQAFLPSLQALQVEAGEINLRIQAIESKNNGAFVVKVAVPDDFDKGEMEKFFWQKYQLQLEAVEEKYRNQLQAKDREINIYHRQSADMMEIAKLLASRPINVENNAMAGDSINQRGNFVAGVQKGGTIQGTVQIIENLNEKETLAEVAANIQKLLAQLETQGFSSQGAKNKVASDLATQANKNPTFKNKLVKWGQYVADAAANGLIATGVVEVIKLAIEFLG